MTESVTLERNAMIKLIAIKDKKMSNGMRDMSRTPLTEDEIEYVKSEIKEYKQMKVYLFLMIQNIYKAVRVIIMLRIRYMLQEMYSQI